MAYPIAAKTQAAGVSAAVSGAALYLLQTYVFKGSVPAGVESLIYLAVPGVVAFAAAYLAPHQVRPSDDQPSLILPSPVKLTAEQEERFRAALAAATGPHEQTAADERMAAPITVAQMVPPSSGSGGAPP